MDLISATKKSTNGATLPNSDNIPVAHIDELYSIRGARMLSDDIMDGKALIRKLVAIYHAASQLEDGTVLIWMDVDTRVGDGGFDKLWYDFVTSRDITYIPEVLCRSELDGIKRVQDLPPYCIDYRVESGVMAITLSATTRELLHRALEWYDGRMLTLGRNCLQKTDKDKDKDKDKSSSSSAGKETQIDATLSCDGPKHQWLWRRNNIGLNDIYVLAHVLHDMKSLRHGWFGNERWTCENPREGGKPWLGQCQPVRAVALLL
jgi:hypothetical protein